MIRFDKASVKKQIVSPDQVSKLLQEGLQLIKPKCKIKYQYDTSRDINWQAISHVELCIMRGKNDINIYDHHEDDVKEKPMSENTSSPGT